MKSGLVIGGKYRLEAEVGRGGMGSVWRAEHLGWQAPIALKLMDPSMSQNPEAVVRFEREARLAAGLRSPHVVQILDHGIDEETGTPFLAMELLDGESLAQRLAQLGCLPPAETAVLMNHIGRALTKAHETGIVHRDLKPDNIFLVRNDDEIVAKVLDFGVAKWDSAAAGSVLTRPGSVVGTPFYMSPEQIRGAANLDYRSDLWSLAIIACECLTGTRPFESPDFVELAMAICEGRNRPLPSNLGVVPAGFDQWFAKAAAVDCNARFTSAREQVHQLMALCGTNSAPLRELAAPNKWDQTLLEGIPSVTPLAVSGATRSGVFSENRRSFPWPKALAATAGLAVVAVLVGGLRMISSPSASTDQAPAPAKTNTAAKVAHEELISPPAPQPLIQPFARKSPNKPSFNSGNVMPPASANDEPAANAAKEPLLEPVRTKKASDQLFVKRARRPGKRRSATKHRKLAKRRKPKTAQNLSKVTTIEPAIKPTTESKKAKPKKTVPLVNGRRLRTTL